MFAFRGPDICVEQPPSLSDRRCGEAKALGLRAIDGRSVASGLQGGSAGDMTRRSLIQRALLVLAAAPVGLIGCVSRRVASGDSPPDRGALGPPPETGPLSTVEMEDLVAFGEVVVEGRNLTPAERRYLFDHIEDRTRRSPGDLALYRLAANTLDRVAAKRFASLGLRERLDLTARHGLAGWRGRPEDDPGLSSPEIRTLRMRIVPDLIRGYYASPAGWAAVDYETFPGRCGDLTRYSRPES